MNIIHPTIREILKSRGISEESDILEFISEKPKRTYDPFLLKNMEAGVDLLLSSIEQNKKICIYGDYDADGVTSISLMLQILAHLTNNVSYYIPSRFDEGYGLNKEAIELIKADGSQLILTVDCGSVSYEEVEYGKNIGMEFIVTDHHNINEKSADCILINPKQTDCTYPFKHLSGCGVAFKVAQAIQRKAGLPKSVLTELLDLVAIATIGDIVPLIDENRTLTKYGLEIINSKKRPGLHCLIEGTGLVPGKIKSENIAYIIVPHLNAAGRMLDAKVGVTLLTSKDQQEFSSAAVLLMENNRERKRIQEESFCACSEMVKSAHKVDSFLLIDAKEIHEGIAGIVAGKLKDEYGRPVIIVTPSGGEGFLKGTGRSIPGINLYDMLKKYEDLFLKFGGHSGACGFLMKADFLEKLRNSLIEETEELYRSRPDLFQQETVIDAILRQEDLDIAFAMEIEKLAPFGCQNEKPVFLLESIYPSEINYMGDNKQHVRFAGSEGKSNGFSCILFQKAQDYSELLQKGVALNLSGYPDINHWNGNSKIQFVLKGITC
jgi:single-stranded-DNA-specific exonuclease